MVASVSELEERRARECRLTPDRALETLDDAEAFLRDRGLLTRTADSALPSLYEACHEQAYWPGKKGFASWPATKWWWFGALEELDDVYTTKVHRGKSLLVTAETAALLDPICRAEIERMRRDDERWRRLLDHLAEAGPSEPVDLQTELELKPRELKSILAPLQRCGAVIGHGIVHHGRSGHTHSSVVARWDQVVPEAAGGGGIADLLVTAVRAAVVAPEEEVLRWFSWRWRYNIGTLEQLVDEGRLIRPEQGWLSAP